MPPGFLAADGSAVGPRRVFAALLLAGVFWLGVFLPLASLGGPEPDVSALSRAQLFLLHGIFLSALAGWYALGFAGLEASGLAEGVSSGEPEAGRVGRTPLRRLSRQFGRQFGLTAPALMKELGIGLVAGIAAWIAVILVLVALGVLIWTLGGEDSLPRQPPALVPWIVGLPIALRLALSGSAGLVEELFFRGFLQPRAGIAFSTVLFVMAHAGYGQPLMLVGVTLLSLVFAALVKWRQNIWSAVVAHAVFDALQLLVVIPKALELLDGGGGLI